MIKNLLLCIRSSIIFSSNNPEIYNFNEIKINSSFTCKYSLEHIFPKCYMNKISYNDMHNIFRCNNYINNIRSNYKYTDFKEIIDIKDFEKIYNTNNYISIDKKLFIPEDDSKGIIARSIMYISYEYNLKYSKIINSSLLINWCLDYPPSKKEIYHNNIIFKKQYKRNKFIDLYNKKNYQRYIKNIFNE